MSEENLELDGYLNRGDIAYVCYDPHLLSNRVRTGPGTGYSHTYSIPVGAVVEIKKGPTYDDVGYVWYKIYCRRAWSVSVGAWRDCEGWTAGGKGEDLYLIRIDPQSLPECESAYDTRLATGLRAYVRCGMGAVNLRSSPSAADDSNLQGQIPERGIMRIVGGPACAEEMTWWQVIVTHSRRGYTGFNAAVAYWISEGQGSTYFLAPLDIPPPEEAAEVDKEQP